jgi:sterol desaturase/sphingolipid hydroxylase (fatty acid hydroxylase superfamily)
MQNNAKVGGVLSIIAGAFGVFGLVMMLFSALTMRFLIEDSRFTDGRPFPSDMATLIVWFYVVLGIFMVLIGVLAIIGGAYALKKKYWGLALAGAIGSIITFFPCGIPAIIFISMARNEFNGTAPNVPPPPPAVVQT